jgi:pantothenate kinase type III
VAVRQQQLLTVDCGNSTIRIRRADGEYWATATPKPDFDGLGLFLGDGSLRAVVASVVPSALGDVCAHLSKMGIPTQVAGVDLSCPLHMVYDTVETLGADRWLGAYAAYVKYGASITVDCGTATTVNLVDATGAFRGGAIGPGLAAFVAGLKAMAPALPSADLDATPCIPAQSTQKCVDAGVLLGWVGLVERLVTDACRGASDSKVVVTGGNAARLLRLSAALKQQGNCVHVPGLLHDGLVALDHEGGAS